MLTAFVPRLNSSMKSFLNVAPGLTAIGLVDPAPVGGVELLNAVFRGLGAPTVKSARLLSVSLAPFALRSAAVVLVSAGVGDASEQFAAPYPTRSMMDATAGHA